MGLLREPLLHFFVLGAALFGLAALTTDIGQDRPDRIVVTAGQVERLAEAWERTWRRPPTAEELETLIEDHIDEEVLYREALALGLDKDDTIIRRRLRQKMEFVARDLAPPGETTDEVLRPRLDAYADEYRLPARFTFVHIYFSPDKRGASMHGDAEAALQRLTGADPVDARSLGDPFSLQREFWDVSATDVDRVFGRGFASRLESAGVGAWAGPIESGYGLHLVWIDAYTPARMPDIDEIRDRLRQDWLAEQHDEQQRAFLAVLRGRYEVSIERHDDGTPDPSSDSLEPVEQ